MEMQVDWNQRYAENTTPWDNPEPCGELVRLVNEGAVRPCPALDLGCGTGSDAIYLARQGFDVTALDVSPLAVSQARRRAAECGVSVRFVAANILDGIEPALTASFVLDNGLYHYLRTVDLPRYLEAVSGMVLPGGAYLAFAGNPNDTDAAPGGPFRVTAREICGDFEAGFELVQLREFRFHTVQRPQGDHRPLGWSILLRRKRPGLRA